MRIKYVHIIVIGFFAMLAAGLAYTMVIQGARYTSLSERNCVRVLTQPGARGRIVDRSGAIIADSKLAYDVLVVPEKLNQLERVLSGIGRVLGRDVRDAFKKGYAGRSVPVKVASNVGRLKAVALEELKFDIPGVMIQQNPVRNYPHGALACHVLGYVNQIDTWRLMKLEGYGYKAGDTVGYVGVEEKYDYYLRQEDGGLSVEVDHRGRSVRLLGVKQPTNGLDLQLTLDLPVQQIVEAALGDRKGSVVLMDPLTGEVIALASAPRYLPAVFSERSAEGITSAIRDPDSPMINRAIGAAYPPGSVFKPIVAVAGIEQKKIEQQTAYQCGGGMNVGKRFFKCWDTHALENLTRAMAHSCDVFFYRTGLLLGPQALHDYALRFGLSRPTGVDIPYETAGHIPSSFARRFRSARHWYDGDTANFSIGQGDVLTTPLQMVRVIAAFANRGYLVTPYLVKSVGDRDLSRFQRRGAKLPYKSAVIERVNEGLRQVVADPSGTAHVLADVGVAVAGKTGTAQAPPGENHAWFVGYFPSDRPKYAICVFLERGAHGYASCLVAKEIIGKMKEQGYV